MSLFTYSNKIICDNYINSEIKLDLEQFEKALNNFTNGDLEMLIPEKILKDFFSDDLKLKSIQNSEFLKPVLYSKENKQNLSINYTILSSDEILCKIQLQDSNNIFMNLETIYTL